MAELHGSEPVELEVAVKVTPAPDLVEGYRAFSLVMWRLDDDAVSVVTAVVRDVVTGAVVIVVDVVGAATPIFGRVTEADVWSKKEKTITLLISQFVTSKTCFATTSFTYSSTAQ